MVMQKRQETKEKMSKCGFNRMVVTDEQNSYMFFDYRCIEMSKKYVWDDLLQKTAN